MATTVADIRSYVLGSTPAANYAVGGASGDIKTAYAKHTDALGDITYYAFSLEALKVIALDTNVSGSSNTNIHLYNDANEIVDYFSKQSNGVLQHEVTLDSGSDVIEYLSFAIEPRTFTATISSTSTYLIKYYTKLDNLSEVASYEKFSSSMIFENRVNGILIVYTDSDFLRAATGQKFDASGDLVPIVDASGLVKYEKEGGAVEYYQKGPSDAPYFKQVNVDESTNPPTVTDIEGPVIWREYSTPDSIDIEEFATNVAYEVGDVLHSGGVVGGSESPVRVYLKEFAGGLKEDVSGDAVYHFVYDNGAYENAVNGAEVGEKIIDLRSVENHMSVGANTSERKNPSREHSELFTVHLAKVLKKDADSHDVYYNYADANTLSEKTFSTDNIYKVNDKLYFMNSSRTNNDTNNDDLSAFTEAFKRVAYALLNTLDQSGDSTSAYKAYNHTGLKNAAVESEILSTGNSVAEAGDLDGETMWYKDSVAQTLNNDDGTYLTFGGISRETFATNQNYGLNNVLIQRTVESDADKTDIISTKLGANAVNKTGDDTTTYAYGNTGLATAARSSDCHANVNLVTAAEYAIDDAVTTYTKMEGKSVLSLVGEDEVLTYYDYSALSTDQDGLTIRSFATDAAYNIGNILSQRDIESGEELDYYIKKYDGLVEDVSGVSNGVEDGQDSTDFIENGKPGSLFYSYANFGEFMRTAFSDDMPVNMVVINVADDNDNEPTASDINNRSYYKRAPGAGGGAGGGSGTVVFTQYGLKAAAGYMSAGQTVDDLDGETVWKKTSIDHTLVRDVGDGFKEYLTFYQPADLSGAVAFSLSRKTFATSNSTYTEGDRLKQAIVKNDNDRDEIISTKLGPNAVNKSVSNESTEYTEEIDSVNTYAYADLGLATAALSNSCNATVKKVTADDYHMDGEEVVDYNLFMGNVLEREGTYYEYSGLVTLTMKTFATEGTYIVGNKLERRDSNGTLIDAYIKKFANLMSDANDLSGGEVESEGEIIYYAYADIRDIINAAPNDVPLDSLIVETTNDNEPSTSEARNKSYIKKAVGLAEKSDTVYHAYSQLGMYNFAILTGKTTSTTVTENSTGFHVDHSGSTTWTWQSQNILRSGSSPYTYLTFGQGASALSEEIFGTSSTTYAINAVLKQRGFVNQSSSVVEVADATPATPTTDSIYDKISHDLTFNRGNLASYNAWSAIGLLNAAVIDLSGTEVRTIIDKSDDDAEYEWIKQHVLLLEDDDDIYFEYSGLSGNTLATSTSTTPSSLSALTLREMATDGTYSVDTQLKRMQQNGDVNETFIKKYDDIMLEEGGEYYAYTEASLATIANDADLPVSTTATGDATHVWQIDGDNEPVNGTDTLWLKIEQYVLRANASSHYIYRSYSFAAGTGISLPEFACKEASANGVTEFGTDDQLIDVSGAITYTRVAKSVLTHSNDDASGAAAVFYVYSFAGHVEAHLALKEAATNASVVANGSILKTESEGNWTKEAHNIVSQPEGDDTNYRTFADVSGYLGDFDFATGEYAIGSALREVRDVDANSQRYLKVLASVLYNYETDLYKAYAEDGLKNAAQATDLSENRAPGADYRLRPQLSEIEVGAFIKDMSAEGNRYLQRTERNVLLDVDLSGSTLSGAALRAAELAASFSASSPAHYYDYDPSGHFGTFTLSELATGSFAVGTLLTDMISEDATFEKMAAAVIRREATGNGPADEYYSYTEAGTSWVAAQTSTVDHWLLEKYTPASGSALNYLVARQNVLAEASGDVTSAGSDLSVPSPAVFYAYSLASDVSGITLLSFANKEASPLDRAFVDGDQLRDRSSSRDGTLYTITASELLESSAGNYLAYGQLGLQSFAGLTLTVNTEVVEQDGAWSDSTNENHQGLTYKWVSLNVLKVGDNSDYYVYNISSDASGLTLNTFATSSSYPKSDTLTVRTSNIYDGPVYTKVILQGVLSYKSDRTQTAEAELRTYDASGSVLGLRNAALAEVSDISDGTVLIPEIDCPVDGRMVNLTAEGGKRRERISKGLLRILNAHGSNDRSTAPESYMAFQAAAEAMPYAALKQAAKNQTAADVAVASGLEVAAESKIFVTADGALAAYNLAPVSYTKDNSDYPDTLRVGDFAPLVACNKITFANSIATVGQDQADLRKALVNFCESDVSGNNATDSKAALYATKTITDYSTSVSGVVYTVVRRGLMSTGANSTLEYFTFSDNGLVAAAVAAVRDASGQFSFVKEDGSVEKFRRVAKGLLVSNSRLNAAAGETVAPTAAIMYFADYDSNKDDDKANMYFYLYSLATLRGVGVDLSGSSTTGDSKTYTRDASDALQLVNNNSDNIIDYVAAGSITTLYSIVNLVGDASGNANYGAEKYETISYSVQDASDVEVANTIKVTPISLSGAMITEDTMTGLSGESFYVAYDPLGMVRSTSAAILALNAIANSPVSVIPRDAYIYLGDKYGIDTGKRYIKYDEGSITGPNGQTLTYSLKGLRAFAHKYSSVPTERSTSLTVGVSGEAADASGTYTQYLDYVYYWFEKGVVVTYGLAGNAALADSEFSMKPAGLDISGIKQRFDIFHKDTEEPAGDQASAHTFVKRALLADISGATQAYADFQKGAFKVGTKFVVHNDNNNEAYPEDIVLFKLDSGLVAKKTGLASTTDSSGFEFYAFNDYALAAGANSSVVNGELLRRMENEDISAPSTNDWSWHDTGLLMDVSGADSGLKWRLYGAPNLVRGRQWFALESDLADEMDYYTYSYPNTTTLVYSYENVLQGSVTNHDLSNNQTVSVLQTNDPVANPDGYVTFGNAGLALLANSADLSGTSLKDTTYKVLPIDIESNIADDLSGAYQKLQQGAMYTGTHMVLYDESKFEEIMDREDITDFATMDANNSYASTIVRATLRPVPLERMFVPDVSGNNQGSALIFETDDVVHGVTTYLVEKVLERDLLGSYAGSSEYVWTTNLMTLVNEQQQPSITTRELEVTNKNGNKQTYRNRTWLRPTDIQG